MEALDFILQRWYWVAGILVAIVAIVALVLGRRKPEQPIGTLSYEILLDRYTELLTKRSEEPSQDKEQLRLALEEGQRLRGELQASEERQLEAAGLSAEPAKLESAKDKAARDGIELRLANVVDHFTLGYEAVEREDWPAALKHYEASLAEERTVAVLNNLAEVYVRMAKYQESLDLYEEAEALCLEQKLPYLHTIYTNRGTVYSNLGRYDEALAAYSKSGELRKQQGLPENAGLAMNCGSTYRKQGRSTDALAEYLKGQAIQQEQNLPADPGFAVGCGNVYSDLERYDEALAAYDTAEQLRKEQNLPEDWQLEGNRGNLFGSLERFEDALAAYGMAERLRSEQGLPVDPSLTFNRALIHASQGDIEMACKLARQARDEYAEHMPQAPVHPNILNFIAENCTEGNGE